MIKKTKERESTMTQPTIFLLAHEPYNEAETKLINHFESLTCPSLTPNHLDLAKFRKIKNGKDGDYWVFHTDISVQEFHQARNRIRPYSHPVVLTLIVKKNNEGEYMLDEAGVIDDRFDQPHFTNDAYNERIFEVCDRLIKKGISSNS